MSEPIGSPNQGIILLGAGGHAKVVMEIFHAAGESVAFCVANTPLDTTTLLGTPVLLGEREQLELLRSQGYFKAHVAIGSNSVRAKLFHQLKELGYTLTSAIHPQATISPTVTIGSGTAIMAGAVINASTVIGEGAIINTGATVDHDCRIGDFAHIGPQCGLAGNITLGDHAFLGIGTKVIPKTTIGKNTTTGAGAIVVCDLPANGLAVGVPARIIKTTKG